MKLLKKYSLLLTVMFMFVMTSAMAATHLDSHKNNKNSKEQFEQLSLHSQQITRSHDQHNTPDPLAAIEYEKSDEEEAGSRDSHVISSPSAVVSWYTGEASYFSKELQKVLWNTRSFVWSQRISRGVFFQVFRI